MFLFHLWDFTDHSTKTGLPRPCEGLYKVLHLPVMPGEGQISSSISVTPRQQSTMGQVLSWREMQKCKISHSSFIPFWFGIVKRSNQWCLKDLSDNAASTPPQSTNLPISLLWGQEKAKEGHTGSLKSTSWAAAGPFPLLVWGWWCQRQHNGARTFIILQWWGGLQQVTPKNSNTPLQSQESAEVTGETGLPPLPEGTWCCLYFCCCSGVTKNQLK